MDPYVKQEFQKLEMRAANAERNIEHTAGRVLALQAALTATLNAWGQDPASVAAELERAFDDAAAQAPKLHMPASAITAFRDLRTQLTAAIQTAVEAP
ncbi:hypothetical protein [Stenotrophomonas sepilia]|uniref:hypothetical protein n=1 Tax=Stenotrophomonas sepilia TaxID=2860290 RepID=UPI002E77F881|nr:hypothetical protein [Stenotrophomonas sepilia]